VTIEDYDDQVLYTGLLSQMTRDKMAAVEDQLNGGASKKLKMLLHLPEAVGNSAMKMEVSFDFSAEAVQTKNNADKDFGTNNT
jgi:hypothetical protein